MSGLVNIRQVVATNSHNGVHLMKKFYFGDGNDWGLQGIFDGELSPADAVELAGSLLKAAGNVLKHQGSAMRMEREPRKKKKASTTPPPPRPPTRP